MQKKDNSIYDLIDIIKAVDKRAGSVNVLDSPLWLYGHSDKLHCLTYPDAVA